MRNSVCRPTRQSGRPAAERGWIPKDYARFLDYAARLIFLQKVGSGYLFVHRQLLEYFADQAETTRAPDT